MKRALSREFGVNSREEAFSDLVIYGHIAPKSTDIHIRRIMLLNRSPQRLEPF